MTDATALVQCLRDHAGAQVGAGYSYSLRVALADAASLLEQQAQAIADLQRERDEA